MVGFDDEECPECGRVGEMIGEVQPALTIEDFEKFSTARKVAYNKMFPWDRRVV